MRKYLANKMNIFSVLLFFLITFFCFWSNPKLEPQIKPDSYGYINLLDSSKNNLVIKRPLLYPLIIKFCQLLSYENWIKLLIIFQIISHSLIIVLLFNMYHKINFSILTSFLLAFGIGIHPSLVLFSKYLLPELLFGVLITLIWYFFIKGLNIRINKTKMKLFFIVSSFLSSLALITKPAWLLGIIPMIILLLIRKILTKFDYKFLIMMIFIHFSLFFIWNVYKLINNPNYESNSILIVNLNMASIRSGLVEYAEETPLYIFLDSKNLIRKVENLNGADGKDFRHIYNQIPLKERSDYRFLYKILVNVPHKLFFAQIKNWHYFFINRMFHPSGPNTFPGSPEFLRYIYIGAYNFIYNPLLPFLLISTMLLGIKGIINNNIILTSIMFIIYFSIVIVMFTKSQSSFMRMRVPIDYILFFTSFLPIGLFIDNIKYYLLKSNS